MPDFVHRVQAVQEQARARRSERERRAEVERAKLKSRLTPRPELLPASAHEQSTHQERIAHHEPRRIAPESDRAWSALVRHARTTTEAEDSRK